MSIYKEDIDEAKERLKAWWDHEIIDRPYIAYYLLSDSKNIVMEYLFEYFGMPRYLAQNWDKFDKFLSIVEEILGNLSFRWSRPNYTFR